MVWAVIVAIALAVVSFLIGDLALSTVLSALTELGLVLALFMIVCAAEALN